MYQSFVGSRTVPEFFLSLARVWPRVCASRILSLAVSPYVETGSAIRVRPEWHYRFVRKDLGQCHVIRAARSGARTGNNIIAKSWLRGRTCVSTSAIARLPRQAEVFSERHVCVITSEGRRLLVAGKSCPGSAIVASYRGRFPCEATPAPLGVPSSTVETAWAAVSWARFHTSRPLPDLLAGDACQFSHH